MAQEATEPDGYYGDDGIDEKEIDLSFLDQDDADKDS